MAASILGGLPSTAHALVTGRDVLDSTRAAGTLVPGRRRRPGLVAGIAVHALISATWTVVVHGVNRRHPVGPVGGGVAGAVIAALDLEFIGRAYPAIRALPRVPQWLDHVAFGVILGGVLSACERNRGADTGSSPAQSRRRRAL